MFVTAGIQAVGVIIAGNVAEFTAAQNVIIYFDGDVLATGGGATCMDSGWHALVQG